MKSLLTTGSGNLINGIGGFVFLIAVARALPVEQYGTFALLSTTFVFLAKLTELGTTSSYVSQSLKNEKDYSRSLLLLKTVLTLLVFFASLFFLNFYGFFKANLIILFLLGFSAYATSDFLFAVFLARSDFPKTSFINALPALFKLIVGIYVIAKTVSLSLDFAVSFYLLALFAPIILIPSLPRKIKENTPKTWPALMELVQKGFPGGLSQAAILLIPALNTILVKLLATGKDVGYFGLSDKLTGIFTLASFSIYMVLLPKKSNELKIEGKVNLKDLISLSALMSVSMVLMILLTKPTLNYLFGTKYQSSIPLLYVLTISAGLSAITSFLDSFFYALEKTMVLLLISLGKIVSVALFSLALFPFMGTHGIALSNVIASALGLILTIGYLFRVTHKRLQRDPRNSSSEIHF